MTDITTSTQRVYKDFHTQELKVIRGPASAAAHEILPEDKVVLLYKKSDDFGERQELQVDQLNPHGPNILKVKNSQGVTTHVSYTDLKLREKIASRLKPGESALDVEELNRYLLWP